MNAGAPNPEDPNGDSDSDDGDNNPPSRRGNNPNMPSRNPAPFNGNSGNREGEGNSPEPPNDGPNGNGDPHDNNSQCSQNSKQYKKSTPAPYNPKVLAGVGEYFPYELKNITEEECLDAILHVYINLVNCNLINKPATGNNNAQKASLQNIPKPEYFHGDKDVIKLDI
ncbi:hypothetical protein GYMLUDRAFT_239487 [Collybiopsis luxurians FD-317 M1]|nr:hypothetical protein GYMLUDRAFT_239487 [Collybiopsis luxurians FD-317 M1]